MSSDRGSQLAMRPCVCEDAEPTLNCQGVAWGRSEQQVWLQQAEHVAGSSLGQAELLELAKGRGPTGEVRHRGHFFRFGNTASPLAGAPNNASSRHSE